MNPFRLVAVFTLVLFLINIAIPALADSTNLFSFKDTTPFDGTYFERTTPLASIKSATQSNPKASLDMGSLHKYLAYGTIVLAGVAATTGSDPGATLSDVQASTCSSGSNQALTVRSLNVLTMD